MNRSGEVHIQVESLRKTFKVPVPSEGRAWGANLKDIFFRRWSEFEVLKGLDFSIARGEFVGYIGANGAGKSTTLKLLTGILQPSSGRVVCAGLNPYSQRYAYTYKIGVVFGQKSILEYEVPVRASFELYREIYEMSRTAYERRLDYFKEILKIDKYWDIPVRKLSFGQRMRCEVAASLLHAPEIVFLDEPTIGLDAEAKNEIRHFLQEIHRNEKVTIILTTHDMKDIEFLCERVLLIDRGRLIYDGTHEQLRQHTLNEKILTFRASQILDRDAYDRLKRRASACTELEGEEVWRVPAGDLDLSQYVSELLKSARMQDFSLSDPELEEVVRRIYGDETRRHDGLSPAVKA